MHPAPSQSSVPTSGEATSRGGQYRTPPPSDGDGGTAIACKGFDFGTALAFMREGRMVHRPRWSMSGGGTLQRPVEGGLDVRVTLLAGQPEMVCPLTYADVLATDWELAPAGEETEGQPLPPSGATPLASSAFDFGGALGFLRQGGRVRRAGWNGKGMWLELVSSATFRREPIPGALMAEDVDTGPFIIMHTAQKTWVPWLCSQADALAADWELA